MFNNKRLVDYALAGVAVMLGLVATLALVGGVWKFSVVSLWMLATGYLGNFLIESLPMICGGGLLLVFLLAGLRSMLLRER